MNQMDLILSKIDLNENKTKAHIHQIATLTQECIEMEIATSSNWLSLSEELKLLKQKTAKERILVPIILEKQEQIAQLEVALEDLRSECTQKNLQVLEYKIDLENIKKQLAKFKQDIFCVKLTVDSWTTNICTIKFSYNKEQYVIVIYDLIENLYTIKEITPNHPNLDELNKFLLKTEDINGLVIALHKYFKLFNEK